MARTKRGPAPGAPGTDPDAIARAPETLALRLAATSAPLTQDEAQRYGERMRAAALQMTLAARSGEPLSQDERAVFLVGLASALPVAVAARLAGRAVNSFYALKRSDSRFRQEWDDAFDASLDEVDERLRTIGITGDPANMSTVRSLEVLRRGRAHAERRDLQLTMRTEDEDGRARVLEVRALAPTPD